MVEVIKPLSDEVVLDPACGTNGFLLNLIMRRSNLSKCPILIGSDFDPRCAKHAETGQSKCQVQRPILFSMEIHFPTPAIKIEDLE